MLLVVLTSNQFIFWVFLFENEKHLCLVRVLCTDYLHSQLIFHRDIKARNILLCSGGICKLADFGSAVDGLNAKGSTSAAGTVHWWPPELFSHRKRGEDRERKMLLAAHDIWSLGVTTIEMVNEYPLFHQLSIEVFSLMMKSTPNHYIDQLPITKDIHLNAFLKECVTVDYRHRPSVRRLLELRFIELGPQKNDLLASNTTPFNEMNVGMITFLDNRERDAQKYANSIASHFLPKWLAATSNSVSDFEHKRSLSMNLLDLVHGDKLILQQQIQREISRHQHFVSRQHWTSSP